MILLIRSNFKPNVKTLILKIINDAHDFRLVLNKNVVINYYQVSFNYECLI